MCAGIVVTASTGRQTGASPTAQQSQGKAARATPESVKAAPVQQRAVALPKPLVSDQLLSLQTSPDAGTGSLHLLVLKTLKCSILTQHIVDRVAL